MRARVFLYVLFGLGCSSLRGEVLSCFSELPLPRFDFLAWKARVAGSGSATFRFSGAASNDKPDFKSEASHEGLRIILDRYLSKAKLAPCRHDAVTLKFRFVVTEQVSEIPLQDVVFRSPETFVITITSPPPTP